MLIKTKIKNLISGGFFYILLGNILNRAIAMISSILVAGLINKEEYAYLGYADNLYGYLSYVMGLGLSSAILKFCSNTDNKSTEKAFFKFSVSIGSVFEIFMSLMICIIVSIVDIPFLGARKYCWMLLLYSTFYNLFTNIICYFRTQLDNRKYAIAGVINSGSLCVFTVIFLKLFNTTGIVVARYFAIFTALVYSVPIINNYFSNTNSIKLEKKQKKDFLMMGITLMIANFFSSIMPLNEAWLVNNIIRDEVVSANFKVAGQFPQLLLLVSGAVTVYFFPIIARVKDGKVLWKKVFEIGIFNFFLILCLTVLGIVFTPFVFHILYKTKYDDAVGVSSLLWCMRAINCGLRMVPINMLPAVGKTGFNLIVSIISCVLQIILDYYFLIHIGIEGVAYGAIIVFFLSALAYWFYMYYVCKKMVIKENND